jgi:hypothetical protein
VVFLAQLITLLVCGRVLGELMQRVGQPAVMGQLIAGILLGPSVLGTLWPGFQHFLFPASPEQKAMIDAISQLGILLLLLLTGMETDLSASAARAEQHSAYRSPESPYLLPAAFFSAVAGHDAARSEPAADHRAISRHCSLNLVGKDRGDGRARSRVPPPHRGPGDCDAYGFLRDSGIYRDAAA